MDGFFSPAKGLCCRSVWSVIGKMAFRVDSPLFAVSVQFLCSFCAVSMQFLCSFCAVSMKLPTPRVSRKHLHSKCRQAANGSICFSKRKFTNNPWIFAPAGRKKAPWPQCCNELWWSVVISLTWIAWRCTKTINQPANRKSSEVLYYNNVYAPYPLCLPLSSKPKNITLREQTHTCFALSQNIFQKKILKRIAYVWKSY